MRQLFFVVATLFLFASPAFGSTQYKQGLSAFSDLDFNKCIRLLKGALQKESLTRSQKVKAWATLAVAYHNNNLSTKAREAWKNAVQLDSKASLPPGQAPSVQKKFEELRQQFLRNLAKKKRSTPARPKTANTKPPVLGQKQQSIVLQPGLRRPGQRPSGVRHPVSPYVGVLGVLSFGVAGFFSYVAQQASINMTQQDVDHFQTFQNAQFSAQMSTAFWISGGVLVSTAAVLLFAVDMKPPSNQAQLPLHTDKIRALLPERF